MEINKCDSVEIEENQVILISFEKLGVKIDLEYNISTDVIFKIF